jgi:hypothetical protein
MENLIEIASNKCMRFDLLKTNVDAVLNSERYTRSKLVTNNLIANSRSGEEAGKALYTILMANDPIVNDVNYSRCFKSTKYVTYNETEISKSEYDVKGLASIQKSTAVIAPSWDGNENGKILLKLTRQTHKKNDPYTGIVYNISTETFNELPAHNIFGQFDHEFTLPSKFDTKFLLEVIIVNSLSLSLSIFLSLNTFSHLLIILFFSLSHFFLVCLLSNSVIQSFSHSVIKCFS